MKICICDDEITQMAYVQNFVNSHFPQINNSNDPISFTQLLPETLINLLNNHLFDFDLIIFRHSSRKNK